MEVRGRTGAWARGRQSVEEVDGMPLRGIGRLTAKNPAQPDESRWARWKSEFRVLTHISHMWLKKSGIRALTATGQGRESRYETSRVRLKEALRRGKKPLARRLPPRQPSPVLNTRRSAPKTMRCRAQRRPSLLHVGYGNAQEPLQVNKPERSYQPVELLTPLKNSEAVPSARHLPGVAANGRSETASAWC